MTLQLAPSPNRSIGRTAGGRFARGNPGGPGNPRAKRVAELRSLLLDTVSDDDLRQIIAVMVRAAKAGDLLAGREVLDRVLGKPTQSITAAVDSPDLMPDKCMVLTQELLDHYERATAAGFLLADEESAKALRDDPWTPQPKALLTMAPADREDSR